MKKEQNVMTVKLHEAIPDFVLPDLAPPSSMRPERIAHNDSQRITTITLHHQAVERVILTMRQRLNEPMSLRQLATVAMLSPYHFNRVFRLITGVTPYRYLNLLRMEA